MKTRKQPSIFANIEPGGQHLLAEFIEHWTDDWVTVSPPSSDETSYRAFLSADFESMLLDPSKPTPLELQLIAELHRIGDECHNLAQELEAKRNAVLAVRSKQRSRMAIA